MKITLTKPVTYKAQEYKELTVDLDGLNGLDLMKANAAQRGNPDNVARQGLIDLDGGRSPASLIRGAVIALSQATYTSVAFWLSLPIAELLLWGEEIRQRATQ